MKTRSTLVVLLCLLATICVPAAWAAPGLDEMMDEFNRRFLVRDQDPRACLDLVHNILQQFPNLNPWLEGMLGTAEVRLLGDNIHDLPGALAACDARLAKTGKMPMVVGMVGAKTRLLVRARKLEEAVAFFEQYQDQVPLGHSDYATEPYLYYAQALDQLGQQEDAVAVLQKALTDTPWLLDERKQTSPTGCLYDALVKGLVAQKRMDEALSWAKVRFMLCAFDTGAIERSTRSLAALWMAKSLSQRDATAFGEAQQDYAKPNPLRDVKLPVIDPAVLEKMAVRHQGGEPIGAAGRAHGSIGVSLFKGAFHDAMVEARQLIIDAPDSPAGAAEICRVFKAADLSVQRANAFIEYMKTGQGANPVESFLKDYPAPAEGK